MRAGRSGPDNEDPWAPQGGYMGAKILKLQDQFNHERTSSTPVSSIFKGVHIFVNGYTEPSFDVLRQLMLNHGGSFAHYYSSNFVTHVIAVNMPQSKQRELENKVVVHPKWITDSIAAGRLLACNLYRLQIEPPRSYVVSSRNLSSNVNVETLCTNDCNNATVRLCLSTETASKMASDSAACPSSDIAEYTDVEVCRLGHTAVSATSSSSLLHNVRRSSRQTSTMARAGDPNFVSEFYSNSRLHHISTWSIHFKELVSTLSATLTSFPGLEHIAEKYGKRTTMSDQSPAMCLANKTYMHIDMDCFFVSVGLRNRPELVGKPVVVSHSRGFMPPDANDTSSYCEPEASSIKAVSEGCCGASGGATSSIDLKGKNLLQKSKGGRHMSMAEIASCSYEARKVGIRNGMLMGTALKLCPDLVAIPYDFDSYSDVATTMYKTVASYTVKMQAVSCDEVFIECSGILTTVDVTPEQLAASIRQDIEEKTQCTASIGIGSNLLVARLATKQAKPNGQLYIEPSQIGKFIKAQDLSGIPGIGWSTYSKLQALNMKTCNDLERLSLVKLQAEFGTKTGAQLYKYARGQDDRELKTDQPRQSVSAEINYGIRLTKLPEVISFLQELSREVACRLQKAGFKGGKLVLKLKVRCPDAPVKTAKFMGHGICDDISKTCSLKPVTNEVAVISKECLRLYMAMHIETSDLRGVGIQIHRLVSSVTKTAGCTVYGLSAGSSKQHSPSSAVGAVPIAIQGGSYLCSETSSKKAELRDVEASNELSSTTSCTGFVEKTEEVQVVQFCGVSDVVEVKALLKAWISSLPGPTFHDESMVTDYLHKLVDIKDLEAVYLLLSFLHMHISKCVARDWESCLKRVTESVQDYIREKHSVPIKLAHVSNRGQEIAICEQTDSHL